MNAKNTKRLRTIGFIAIVISSSFLIVLPFHNLISSLIPNNNNHNHNNNNNNTTAIVCISPCLLEFDYTVKQGYYQVSVTNHGYGAIDLNSSRYTSLFTISGITAYANDVNGQYPLNCLVRNSTISIILHNQTVNSNPIFEYWGKYGSSCSSLDQYPTTSEWIKV